MLHPFLGTVVLLVLISRNALLNEQEVLDRLTFFSLSFSLGLFHLSDFRYFVKHNNI